MDLTSVLTKDVEGLAPPPDRAVAAAPIPPVAAAHTKAGVFKFGGDDNEYELDLHVIETHSGAIPEDQRKISCEAYEAVSILKLLAEQGVIKRDKVYAEFVNRIREAADVGCVSPNVDTAQAEAAFEQIRVDIVRRRGRQIVYHYLLTLAGHAAAGVALAAIAIAIANVAAWTLPGTSTAILAANVPGYSWVIMGAMAGAWLSVAAGRREVSFESIQDYLNYGHEPCVRMVFVAVLAWAFALLLSQGLLPVVISGVEISTFHDNVGLALTIGLIAGIGERTLSVQLVARTTEILSPGKR